MVTRIPVANRSSCTKLVLLGTEDVLRVPVWEAGMVTPCTERLGSGSRGYLGSREKHRRLLINMIQAST